jgi:phosphatidylserine/phosphatidylglycerophosphate/cardiolipin synthase-like enzyme
MRITYRFSPRIRRHVEPEEASRGDGLRAGPSARQENLPRTLEELGAAEAVFSRGDSIAEVVEDFILSATESVYAAVYRFNSRRIARALSDARRKGIEIRLVVDKSRYERSRATQELLAKADFPFRLAQGRDGEGSKMHHKFVVLDEQVVLTGSYNWTYASEEKNHEGLLVLKDAAVIEAHLREFHELWDDEAEPPVPDDSG